MNTGVKSPLFYTTIISPIGPIYIAFTKKGASRIALCINSKKAFVKDLKERYHREVKRDDRGVPLLKKRIMAYFTPHHQKATGINPWMNGYEIPKGSTPKPRLLSRGAGFTLPARPFSLKSFIDLLEGTPFEKKVWFRIKKIPYGKVLSYKDLAIMVGRPKAARAIGMACRKNPLPILIPCHRVVGKDHSLKGYSSGINIKRRLLEIEGVKDIK